MLGEEAVRARELEATGARLYGPVLVGHRLWEQIGLSEKIARHIPRRRNRERIVQAAEVMVLNRLVEPGSKLAVTRWVRRVYLPQWDGTQFSVQHFYRALDVLHEAAEAIEEELFCEQRTLFEPGLDMVFYDVTSTYFEGEGPQGAEFGYSRDGHPDRRQIVIGLLVNRDGLPLGHRVFPGNMADAATVPHVLDDLRQRFGIERVIFVGDRGMVSRGNLEALRKAGYSYIVGLRKRAGSRCLEAVEGIEEGQWQQIEEGLRVAEAEGGDGERIIICHSEAREEEEREILAGRLARGEEALGRVASSRRGQAALIGAGRALREAKAGRYFGVWLDESGRLCFARRQEAVAREEMMLGMYFLLTDAGELGAEEIAGAYKQLQRVEAAFRQMKDFLRLRPIYHWRQRRVEAHVFVCVLAYLLERLLELKLAEAGVELSARRALEEVGCVSVVEVEARGQRMKLVTRPTAEARAVLRAVGIGRLGRVIDEPAEP